MTATELVVGSKVWYLFLAPGNGLTHQEEVEVLAVKGERAKIKRKYGSQPVWVKAKNLRRTA